jgi:hypothetical protein
LIVEEAIGRYLTDEEIVHHKDGDESNDSLDNLQVMTQAEHAALEVRIRKTDEDGNPIPTGVKRTNSGKWSARRFHDKICYHVGVFNAKEEAEKASAAWTPAMIKPKRRETLRGTPEGDLGDWIAAHQAEIHMLSAETCISEKGLRQIAYGWRFNHTAIERLKSAGCPVLPEKHPVQHRKALSKELITSLLDTGMNLAFIARQVGVGRNTLKDFMRVNLIPIKTGGKKKPDSEISYAGHIARVSRFRGKPNRCDRCGTDTAKKYEWVSVDRNYSEYNAYIRMCASCADVLRGVVRNFNSKNTTIISV